MARIRSVPPEICDLEELSEASDFAERTFVRLATHMDDEGRARFNPKLLKAALFPLRDSVDADDLTEAVYELRDLGLLIVYNVDGALYVQCRPALWKDWQKPRHPSPSKLPAPPDDDCYSTVPAERRNPTAGVPPQDEPGRSPHAGVGVEREKENYPPSPPSADGGNTSVTADGGSTTATGGSPTADRRTVTANGGVPRETPRVNPRAAGTNPRSLAALVAPQPVDRTRDHLAFAALWSAQVPDDPRFVVAKALEAFPESPIDQQTAYELWELAVAERARVAAAVEPAGGEMGG